MVLADASITRIAPKDVTAITDPKEKGLLELFMKYGVRMKDATGDVK